MTAVNTVGRSVCLTKTGAYVCRQEADRAGDRPTGNGQ